MQDDDDQRERDGIMGCGLASAFVIALLTGIIYTAVALVSWLSH